MEYKSTNNYGKAQSKYNLNQKNNSDVLSKIITAYKGLNTYGQLKNTTQTAQFGRKVAEHYKHNEAPDWLTDYLPDYNKTLRSITGVKEMAGKAGIEGYAPVEDGLFGMIKNMYSPNADFDTLNKLGTEALKQGKTQLANEGMSAEALSGANEGSMSSVLSSPYAPYIMAILGAGIGAGKQGSTLQNWLNPDGGY